MFNNNKLAKSVRLAIAFGAAATALPTAQAFAAEEETIEKIQVTGSRISQTDMESALPVTVISTEDIQATGLADVGSVIAQMPFNTQGSFVSAAGSSATNHSSSGLRGLGSNRTLTLINGKRIAPSATFGGESTNLNLIPIEAVERIDILRDGAASIYGSDAIGGVINVILKDDYEGLSFKTSFGRPSGETGDEDSFSFTVGSNGEKGSSLFIFEHKEWEGIKYGTRAPVLNADFELPYNRSSLYAPEGNYFPIDAEGNQSGPWVPGNGSNCPADRIVDLGAGGQRCGYAFLDGKNFIPARTKDSVFGNFTYSVSDTIEWQTEVMALRDTTNTAGTSVWTPGGIDIAADNPVNPTFGTANATDIRAYTRLVGVADRSTDFDTTTFHLGSTLSFEFDSGFLDITASASRQDVNLRQEHYIFRDKFDEAVEAGLYNPFVLGGNASEETLNSFLHTNTRKAFTATRQIGANWAAETDIELDGGNIQYAVGAEWQDYRFADELDRQSSPGGSAFPTFGGNSGGERSYWAAFGEVDIPVTEDINVKAATRYDKYSLPDEGQLSSSVNIRYQATEDLVLRASYSQGFRAPSIDDLLSEEALSFNRVTDPIYCATLTDPSSSDFCGDGEQIERVSSGNSNLGPETSDQYSVGVVWDIIEGTSIVLDLYDIQINDQVQFLGAQDVVDLEVAGLLGDFDNNAINVIRDENQQITRILTGSINQVGTSVRGLDVDFKSRLETDNFGTFFYAFAGSYSFEYETQATPTAPRLDEVGSVTTPKFRYTTSLGYTIDDFNAKLTYRFIPRYSDLTVVERLGGLEGQGQESWGIVDLNSSYDFGDFGTLQLGVRNLADKLPELNQTFRNGFDTANHSVQGRVVYGSYTIQF
jgi:iron complex outermembrane receptor protein